MGDANAEESTTDDANPDSNANSTAEDDTSTGGDQADGEGAGSGDHTITISVVDHVQFAVRENGTYSYTVSNAEGYEGTGDNRLFDVNGNVELTVELAAIQRSAASSDLIIEGVEGDTENDSITQD